MNIHPEFIQPIQDMYGQLIRGNRDSVFVDDLRENPESIQFIEEILRYYPHGPSKGLPAYHFIDIPDEEFSEENFYLSTILCDDDEDGFGYLDEDELPLRTDINSVWEVEGVHPWTQEEGQATDLCAIIQITVEAGGKITAKLIDIHQ